MQITICAKKKSNQYSNTGQLYTCAYGLCQCYSLNKSVASNYAALRSIQLYKVYSDKESDNCIGHLWLKNIHVLVEVLVTFVLYVAHETLKACHSVYVCHFGKI